jgi:hypothetical protein
MDLMVTGSPMKINNFKMKLEIKYSVESEVQRITDTLAKYSWFKEQRYRLNLPEQIRAKADLGEVLEKEYIEQVIKGEFLEERYLAVAEAIQKEWAKVNASFTKNLATLNGPKHDIYRITLTRYGVGGSYGFPNKVIINFEYKDIIFLKTVAHEIVHMAIEGWIMEYKITHWVKERLVDLVMNKFFPDHMRLQRDPEQHEEIEALFETYFPDMKKVIESVDELKTI